MIFDKEFSITALANEVEKLMDFLKIDSAAFAGHSMGGSVAPDKTKWNNFLEQIFAFDKVPFNIGDSNISKIAAPVLILSGDNDGADKVELMQTTTILNY